MTGNKAPPLHEYLGSRGRDRTDLLRRNEYIITGSPVFTSPKSCFKTFYEYLIRIKGGLRSEVEDSWVEMMKKYDYKDAREEYWERECHALEELYDGESEDEVAATTAEFHCPANITVDYNKAPDPYEPRDFDRPGK